MMPNGAILQRLTERLDAGIVLHRGSFPTIDHSPSLTYNNVLLGSACWPAMVCQRILAGEQDFLTAAPSTTKPCVCSTCSRVLKRRRMGMVLMPKCGSVGTGRPSPSVTYTYHVVGPKPEYIGKDESGYHSCMAMHSTMVASMSLQGIRLSPPRKRRALAASDRIALTRHTLAVRIRVRRRHSVERPGPSPLSRPPRRSLARKDR